MIESRKKLKMAFNYSCSVSNTKQKGFVITLDGPRSHLVIWDREQNCLDSACNSKWRDLNRTLFGAQYPKVRGSRQRSWVWTGAVTSKVDRSHHLLYGFKKQQWIVPPPLSECEACGAHFRTL